MRAWPAARDLPDGVVDGDLQASLITADLKREAAVRRYLRHHHPEGGHTGLERLTAPERREALGRRRLFARARRGDQAAAAVLWRRYRCRLILPGVPRA